MNIFEAFQQFPAFYITTICILGLLIGSFLNVVIYRLPVMMERTWRRDSKAFLDEDALNQQKALERDHPKEESNQTQEEREEEVFNLVFPHSHCPSCNNPVRAWQNIPLISYAFLAGKCGYCKTNISIRYPIIELVTGILSALVAWQFGPTWLAFAALLLTWCLIPLTMIDFDHQLLPDDITLPLIWIGLLVNSFELFTTLNQALWGAILGYGILWSIFWLFKLLTGKEGMGYGDFKLLAALGAWFGWQALPIIILLSSLVGAVIGITQIRFFGKDGQVPIPFGPYLAGAGWISMMWGEQITAIYFNIMAIN